MAQKNINRLTGVVVPLGALYTKENPVIGEFADLIPFADFCKASGIGLIQLLPVNDSGTQSSPYSGLSAFALHPLYIRIKDVPGFNELAAQDEKFKKAYDELIKKFNYSARYDYDGILNRKNLLLQKLYEKTQAGQTGNPDDELAKWIKANSWVKTYAVYKNLKVHYLQASWKSWLKTDQKKTKEEITALWNQKAFKKEHLFFAWVQSVAAAQFEKAVEEIHKKGILIKGDMPILMNEDSADTWAFPEFFNQNLRAGSPSDGENPAGQNWGFPTYNWKNLKEDNYSWWKDRLKLAEKYYDAYRLDHILGFFRIWAIPSEDENALNGHTEPYAAIKAETLYEAGFDEDRIRWLSRPHIPTSVIEDITWNHQVAVAVLEKVCDRIGEEELWLFKKSVAGSAQLRSLKMPEGVTQQAAEKIRSVLVEYWTNKTLNEVSKNKFIPLWTYAQSTSWKSLNQKEQEALTELFTEINEKNEKVWKKQAEDILGALTSAVKMVPCGEDLGVGIECVPEVMKKQNILGLRVVRWCRDWGKEGQPFVPFENYEPLSVTTTSVHDSSTIRQWWTEEKESVKAFIKENMADFGINKADFDESQLTLEIERISAEKFAPEIAEILLKASARTKSAWFVPPLQDFLFLNQDYYLEKAEEERINVPGTVTAFNWTYRIPCTVEALLKDKALIEKIKKIAGRK